MKWSDSAFALAKPILHGLDAERAHHLTLRALRAGLGGASQISPDPRLSISVLGRSFSNPLGLAAGFDKNGEAPDALLRLGFGFVEIGTVTPQPQAGNPKPRLFRLSEDKAVINRMGFNNDGHERVHRRLVECGRMGRGIIGVNIGANKDSTDRIADYVEGYRRFSDIAHYITVNVSSPNTPGLRSLQQGGELVALLSRLRAASKDVSKPPPLLLKIAPDLTSEELRDIASACIDGPVDGVVISNTTIARPKLRSPHGEQQGGLSGRPLFDLATRQLARFYLFTGGRLPLVGVGGISDAQTAWMKIRAGASLLQLYTALVFDGPGLIRGILSGLAARLEASGYGALEEAVGCEAEAIAAHGSSGM